MSEVKEPRRRDLPEEKKIRGCEVRLDQVSKEYTQGAERITALDQISLEVKSGKFLAIMGASGSGKSTLLNLVAGLDKPSQGEIFLNGQAISGWTDNQLTIFRRQELGFIFQLFNLIPTLSAEENAALPLLMAGRPRSVWQPQVDRWLKRVGLESRRKNYPAELSGGQMQRIAIIRALIHRPALILADEPTGNLDSKTGDEMLFILKEITEDLGVTLIMVTHNPMVAAYGHTLVTLKDGRILDSTAR
ncbi:ABC-type antimicrobial peptide transport system, ATPase component [Desulfosporosinus orientis DSM 765]|uniref:ABC-type antimicrobial peptide transport system, ATPase component n=1 Tax=Desulfosporosinus orientis (strain ATCC 19365 / DSM 765 / NCIMB 8382 / VKM B-1628 / Singapore I) TaxID=768706 RepID=G7WHP8_DESOD|nr:ABC transporter ATP-binding protein [Desulfosporosinus orientis]AET69610.1 ABC-type antimicrobial peptide transport system, ATPase component [Desulfosporosinus orientis DSM 765]